jgi:uncharacterized oligopeptide transporter (OPT) family protein
VWCAILLIILAVFPIQKILISEWIVQVVDQSDTPISGIRVTQIWNNYTFSISGGADLYTSAKGIVTFPQRVQSSPVGYWIAMAVWTKITFGVHASSGTIGTVNISDLKASMLVGANCANQRCTSGTIRSNLITSLR